jgi:hypothetical protein
LKTSLPSILSHYQEEGEGNEEDSAKKVEEFNENEVQVTGRVMMAPSFDLAKEMHSDIYEVGHVWDSVDDFGARTGITWIRSQIFGIIKQFFKYALCHVRLILTSPA